MADIELRGRVCKADSPDGVVYGYAVVLSVNGQDYTDLQGDVVEPESLVKAATEFMKSNRTGKVMHEGSKVGQIVHSLPLDADIAKALDITAPKLGWVIGFLPSDESVAKQFRDGTLKGFSIGGLGERTPIEDAA